jgi:hypothetical protein
MRNVLGLNKLSKIDLFTSSPKSKLAASLMYQGQYEEAGIIYREILPLMEIVLGKDHQH